MLSHSRYQCHCIVKPHAHTLKKDTKKTNNTALITPHKLDIKVPVCTEQKEKRRTIALGA